MPLAADQTPKAEAPAANPAPLRGEWVATNPYPDGSGRRVTTLAFTDATAATYRLTAEGSGVRSTVTLTGTYALAGDRLTFTPAARFAGEEPLPLRDADKTPRVYTLTWAAGRRSFDLTSADARPTARFVPCGSRRPVPHRPTCQSLSGASGDRRRRSRCIRTGPCTWSWRSARTRD